MSVILYLGDSRLLSTSAHRAYALERLGHTVIIKDPNKIVAEHINSKWLSPLHYHTGYRFLQSQLVNWVSQIKKETVKVDLIWVDSGHLFGTGCLKVLKTFECPVVLYNVDDPTGKRDGHRFDSLLKAISFYDLVIVVRKETKEECEKIGAKKVMEVLRSYDEIAHQPFSDISNIPNEFKSDVAFIGTWMRHENRDKFLFELKQQNIPISIWGDRWNKSKYWEDLKSSYRGGALAGREYVAAIQGAKICLGLLSKGNRDLHTQRSLEVPFAGGLFCAERTVEHQKMYREGVEAVFWANADECAKVCKELLNNDDLRESIRTAGMLRVKELSTGNEDVCKRILDELNIK
ncbi:glycosyltransferase family 1 protein [bacterium]|nr:MAG: glycosyltransferase family 1 protein [bacterium]